MPFDVGGKHGDGLLILAMIDMVVVLVPSLLAVPLDGPFFIACHR